MNFKLSAFFFASGVMQIYGQCDVAYSWCKEATSYSACDVANLWCSCERTTYGNPVLTYGNPATSHGACDVAYSWCNKDAATQERNNWCNDSNDWKWVTYKDGEAIPNPYVRKLDELDVLALLSSSCVETFYKISIKTIGEHGHIGCIAEPSCKDADNIKACVDCPSYVFHASLDAEHPDVLQKVVEEIVVVVVDDKENVKPDIHHEIEHLYELQELLGAFKDVELDDNESYNLMYNNCGTFLIKMAHNLGIDPTDPNIINSVATMLSPTTKVGAVIGGSKYMARFIGNYVHAN